MIGAGRSCSRGIHDLAQRVYDPDVDAESVIVLRTAGRVGAPDMPEWGHLPIRRSAEKGVSDLLRISDARMSGTFYWAVVLHVAPESAVGGPLALIETDDRVRLNAEARRLDMLVDEAERRRARGCHRRERTSAEYQRLYEEHVPQANEGCDLDFLRGRSPVITDAVTEL
jgi:dihydroxy-acid dehydratase